MVAAGICRCFWIIALNRREDFTNTRRTCDDPVAGAERHHAKPGNAAVQTPYNFPGNVMSGGCEDNLVKFRGHIEDRRGIVLARCAVEIIQHISKLGLCRGVHTARTIGNRRRLQCSPNIINLPGLISIQPGNDWPLLWQHFHQSLGIQVTDNLPDHRTAYPQLVAQRALHETLPWLEQTSNDCITEPLKGDLP